MINHGLNDIGLKPFVDELCELCNICKYCNNTVLFESAICKSTKYKECEKSSQLFQKQHNPNKRRVFHRFLFDNCYHILLDFVVCQLTELIRLCTSHNSPYTVIKY